MRIAKKAKRKSSLNIKSGYYAEGHIKIYGPMDQGSQKVIVNQICRPEREHPWKTHRPFYIRSNFCYSTNTFYWRLLSDDALVENKMSPGQIRAFQVWIDLMAQEFIKLQLVGIDRVECEVEFKNKFGKYYSYDIQK